MAISWPEACDTIPKRIRFCWRIHKRLIDWHNAKAKELDSVEFREWKQDTWQPKIKRLHLILNNMRFREDVLAATTEEERLEAKATGMADDTYDAAISMDDV